MAGITFYYLAPEVSINDNSLISSKSDIFSFGMLIFYMINIFFRTLYELVTERKVWQIRFKKEGKLFMN